MRRSEFAAPGPNELDRTTVQLCYGTSAGLLVVGSLGYAAEMAIGVGGHLSGLLVFSLGYLCCGVKQQISIWLTHRQATAGKDGWNGSALADGCLPQTAVLPPKQMRNLPLEATQFARVKPLNCL